MIDPISRKFVLCMETSDQIVIQTILRYTSQKEIPTLYVRKLTVESERIIKEHKFIV